MCENATMMNSNFMVLKGSAVVMRLGHFETDARIPGNPIYVMAANQRNVLCGPVRRIPQCPN